MVWASNVSGVSEKQLFELVTLSIDELVKRLYVRFMKADLNGATNYNTYDVAKTNPKWIEEKRHRSFGRCYMLHFPEDIRYLPKALYSANSRHINRCFRFPGASESITSGWSCMSLNNHYKR